jgi:RNA polymerase sigma-70 factor (ECF subfamily)
MSGDPYEEYRGLLFSIAYRVLGTAADAEDAVQDTWLKWSAADRSRVADPRAYLVRIVTNVSIDRLRAARSRRETYVGPWLPEPIPTSTDTTVDADSVSIALLVVLETLSPIERAVFVLREAFDFSHAEIAEAMGRSEESVRRTAHRARAHVSARRPRLQVDRRRQHVVTERFLAAATGGDINALLELMAPDVALWTDGGGKVRQALKPVIGAERVAAWFAGVARRPYEGVEPAAMATDVVELNGTPAVVFSGAGRVIAVLSLDLDADGRIVALHNIANPDKLRMVGTGPAPHRRFGDDR